MAKTLSHYLNGWQLSNPHLLAATASSQIYRVETATEMAVLKLLTPLGAADEKNGAVALRYFNGQGVVRLLQEDEQAHLLEYAAGEDLLPLVKQGDDLQATAIMAEVIARLHGNQRQPPPQDLPTLSRWFRALFERAKMEQNKGDPSIFRRGALVAERLLNDPQEVRVLHGDIHHANIRHHAGRGWLAFDPKGLYGERTYDAANILCNPIELPEVVTQEGRLLAQAQLLATHLHLDLARLLAFTFAYACLSASWSLEDGQSPTLALQVAAIVEPLLLASPYKP